MKITKLLPALLIFPLLSCSQNPLVISDRIFCFDTSIEVKFFDEGNDEDLKEIKNILGLYAGLSDNYYQKGNNVYYINTTNEEVEVDENLYKLLNTAFTVSADGAEYFNLLCGQLSLKWKASLANNEVLPDEVINSELEKISNSSLLFKENNIVQRVGEAIIDLGGIAKGYALDYIKDYIVSKGYTKYLVNGGNSSILLGEKNGNNGYFNVGIADINNAYIMQKNCFVSTSGLSTQGVEINGIKYSHIINPITGSAINNYDAVIVISEKGYYGDAMSTSMMMNTIEEIKALEVAHNIKTIVIKDGSIIYKNEGIEVYYH